MYTSVAHERSQITEDRILAFETVTVLKFDSHPSSLPLEIPSVYMKHLVSLVYPKLNIP